MPSDAKLAEFGELAVRLGGYRTTKRALFRCRQTFQGMDLTGKNLLEIGAGLGVFSAYAAVAGAGHVVALEPEAAGSTSGYVARIHEVREALGAPNFEVSAATVQDYDNQGRRFDIVLSYNSVNHLDEASCMALAESEDAREVYRGIFRKIAGMMNPGGVLILADASRRNFFPMIGLKNPFARMIEWKKHQSPGTWCRLIEPLGFVKRRLSWYCYHPLRHLGPVAANRVVSFFLTSHFRLVLRYEGPPAR